jgi:hypothetical protein
MPETIQVMISYGALDNGQLMECYGFYDETNEMDAVWLSEGELEHAAKSLLGQDEVDAAASLCHELGVGPGKGVEGGNYAVYKSGEGEELMVCLRRLCIGFEPCSSHHFLLLLSFLFCSVSHILTHSLTLPNQCPSGHGNKSKQPTTCPVLSRWTSGQCACTPQRR